MAINIYITSFYRIKMTLTTIALIQARTTPGTFKIHIFDNGSDKHTKNILIKLLEQNKIESLHLNNTNTGCLYNKGIFHMLTPSTDKYYCVTDNDIYPPKLNPDWLTQMTTIMDKNPNLGMLTPQLPPQILQQPFGYIGYIENDIIPCKFIGNTLKLIRTNAFPIGQYEQALRQYSDDSLISNIMRKKGWQIAFCKNIFCYHAGQCTNWGYTPNQINLDPRKSNYNKPFKYNITNTQTYTPEQLWIYKP